MGPPIGTALVTDVTLCIGMNCGLMHSLSVTGDQRGLSRDESGRYGELARTTMTYRGMAYSGRPPGPRSAHRSRGGHVPSGRPAKRAPGETGEGGQERP